MPRIPTVHLLSDDQPAAEPRRCVPIGGCGRTGVPKVWMAAVADQRCCTCRCGAAGSVVCVAGIIAAATIMILTLHRLAMILPGERCLEGLHGSTPSQVVQEGDDWTCSALARRLGVAEFDLVDRNTSRSCCEDAKISVGDVVDVCADPSHTRWRPRPKPDGHIVQTYVGAYPAGLPPPDALPDFINVAALAFAADVDGQGLFEMGGSGSFADCAAQVNPSAANRGESINARSSRRWLVSIIPEEGNQWPRGVSAERWGHNAAASLERLILRYRLDGIDVDYEAAGNEAYPNGYGVFTESMCSLFSHLQERLPGVLITASFYGNIRSNEAQRRTIPVYEALMDRCGERLDWLNYQNYGNWVPDVASNVRNVQDMGKKFGWEKLVIGVGVGGSDCSGKHYFWSPSEENGHHGGRQIMRAIMASLKPDEYRPKGVFTWAAEFSANAKVGCKPAWCVERSLAVALGIGGVVVDEECECPNEVCPR